MTDHDAKLQVSASTEAEAEVTRFEDATRLVMCGKRTELKNLLPLVHDLPGEPETLLLVMDLLNERLEELRK